MVAKVRNSEVEKTEETDHPKKYLASFLISTFWVNCFLLAFSKRHLLKWQIQARQLACLLRKKNKKSLFVSVPCSQLCGFGFWYTCFWWRASRGFFKPDPGFLWRQILRRRRERRRRTLGRRRNLWSYCGGCCLNQSDWRSGRYFSKPLEVFQSRRLSLLTKQCFFSVRESVASEAFWQSIGGFFFSTPFGKDYPSWLINIFGKVFKHQLAIHWCLVFCPLEKPQVSFFCFSRMEWLELAGTSPPEKKIDPSQLGDTC